jgi:hypothetical protein
LSRWRCRMHACSMRSSAKFQIFIAGKIRRHSNLCNHRHFSKISHLGIPQRPSLLQDWHPQALQVPLNSAFLSLSRTWYKTMSKKSHLSGQRI